MLLDEATLEQLRSDLERPGSAMLAVLEHCKRVRSRPDEHKSGGYQGTQFASMMASCALSYRVTGKKPYGKTAMRYFRALLDDWAEVGDGKGGADVVRHNTGYAMRFFAPYAALGYDWLHDAPGMTEELRELARQRFHEWASWYRSDGYLNDMPGANYHAGYVFGVAMIAAALQPDGTERGEELRTFVEESIYGKDLATAMAPGGALHGGDWPEGWQYGPLSVAEYALGARALAERGSELPDMRSWARALLYRFVHGLEPTRRGGHIGGDTGHDQPFLEPDGRTLYAVIYTPGTSAAMKARALSELSASGYRDKQLPALQALAEAMAPRDAKPVRVRRQLSYLADGTQTLFLRTSWSGNAHWLVASCSSPVVSDHQHVTAGTFELVNGKTPLITDPTPYGSLGTVASNAPTVDSANLPDDYRPSQGPWGHHAGFTTVATAANGITVARCDYAGQYRFKQRPSKVSEAMRTFVFAGDDRRAALIVWDRAGMAGDDARFELRFRSPLRMKSGAGGIAQAASSLGDQVRIDALAPGAERGGLSALSTDGKCWEGPRGRCRFSRYPGTEYRLTTTTEKTPVVHVIRSADGEAAGRTLKVKPRWVERDDYRAAKLESPALTVIEPRAHRAFQIEGRAKRSYVLLDVASTKGVEVVRKGERCLLRVPAARSKGAATSFDVDAGCDIVKPSALPLKKKPYSPAATAAAEELGQKAQAGVAGAGPVTRIGHAVKARARVLGLAAVVGSVMIGMIAWRARRN